MVSFFRRFLLMAVLWLVVTGADRGAWWFGAFAAAAAAALSLRLLPPRPGHLRAWPTLALFGMFARDSVLGGLDVARRAFDPRLPMHPGWLRLPLRMAPGPRRMLLGDILSLMPGSMGAGDQGPDLLVHCLDVGQPVRQQVERTERHLRAASGEADPSREDGHAA
ncbi:Na+/H+ antiporter subunit E [Ramlibacter sp. AW1]|uniref:Na+/H+ antiporter subunit E n=1 Tax=Ramlibacter aurantiacus TaxID=2801330 RepID=A0A936ZG34_9BURK|nr:Na+/H+ antiporter subunit E [Ramlibacter aurantiacus]MBL0420282.1 Na+/H+ antiporter subunit E [Ramlibacter aurantiacus]